MVYSPSVYLVASAVATVALQIQHATASSLYYQPVTISRAANLMSEHFAGKSDVIAAEDCEFEVKVDPTMPVIANILSAPVIYPELLASSPTSPTKSLLAKVGTVVFSASNEVKLDSYVTLELPSATNTHSTTGNENASGETDKHGNDECATGWEKSTATASTNVLNEKNQTNRRLEAFVSTDIEKLEKHFGTKIETTLANLPKIGVLRSENIPWPGPYWPKVEDSINVHWLKENDPPSLKYAKAFGLNGKRFANKVSNSKGIDHDKKASKCEQQAQCVKHGHNDHCGIRANQTSGYCIAKWVGICHAWSVVSILEKEPKCPVTYNGVTFRPMDIKGLLSYLYDGALVPTILVGSRYNKNHTDSKDQFGRSTSPSFRDLNAGFFHIALANILGRFNSSFIIDVAPGEEVWNQPLRGFLVVEQIALSLEEAAHIFYGLTEYPWNAAAKSIVFMKTRVSWIGETYEDGGLVASGAVDKHTKGKFYSYLLELDGDGKIIGGEWVYGSINDHPDFMWFATNKPAADTVLKDGMSYADVSMLLEKSAACSDIEPTAGSPTESSTSNANSEGIGTPAPDSTPAPGSTPASNADFPTTA